MHRWVEWLLGANCSAPTWIPHRDFEWPAESKRGQTKKQRLPRSFGRKKHGNQPLCFRDQIIQTTWWNVMIGSPGHLSDYLLNLGFDPQEFPTQHRWSYLKISSIVESFYNGGPGKKTWTQEPGFGVVHQTFKGSNMKMASYGLRNVIRIIMRDAVSLSWK